MSSLELFQIVEDISECLCENDDCFCKWCAHDFQKIVEYIVYIKCYIIHFAQCLEDIHLVNSWYWFSFKWIVIIFHVTEINLQLWQKELFSKHFYFIFRICYCLHDFFCFYLQERNNQQFKKKWLYFLIYFINFHIFLLLNAIWWMLFQNCDILILHMIFFYICLFLWFSYCDFHVFMFFLLCRLLHLLSMFIKSRNNQLLIWQAALCFL